MGERPVPDEPAYIVSDLHLGSEFFYRECFLAWLRQLPAGARLILNGDVIDDPTEQLPPAHAAVLRELAAAAAQRPVVWVRGNHDDGERHPGNSGMQFVDHWLIPGQVLVMHGDFLDDVMPRHEAFKWVFRRLHALRLLLGARRVHVAEYAKRWRLLYDVLDRHVARNAARRARELGCPTIVCGHTHAVTDRLIEGVRYVNTGAWTEKPLCYAVAGPDGVRLEEFDGGAVR